MQIGRIRPAGRGGHLLAVALADGRRFLVDAARATPLGLAEGVELDAAVEERLITLAGETRAREAALTLLRYRPRSRAELASRLRRRGLPPVAVESVLAELEASGVLDDRRFAKLWTESRLSAGRSGLHRLRAELRLKGVPPEIIEETLRTALPPEEETRLAASAAERYLARAAAFPPEVRLRRLAGLLRRRGFSGAAIAPILRESARRLQTGRTAPPWRRRVSDAGILDAS